MNRLLIVLSFALLTPGCATHYLGVDPNATPYWSIAQDRANEVARLQAKSIQDGFARQRLENELADEKERRSGAFIGRTSAVCKLDGYLANVAANYRDRGDSQQDALPRVIQGFNGALADKMVNVTQLYRYRIPIIVEMVYTTGLVRYHAPYVGGAINDICIASEGTYIK
jgi:hypothetical protein